MREYLKNTLTPLGNCLENRYDKRQGEWKKQRKKYGFDERQTWNLSTTMIELLYERVMMFKEVSFVDLDLHKIIIDNEERSQSEWINIIIGLCENYLMEDDTGEAVDLIMLSKELEVRIWEIWSKISWHMWW